MTVTGSLDPAWLQECHEWDQVHICQARAGREDRAAQHDSVTVNQHDMARLTKPNRVGGRSEEFLGIQFSMQDTDCLISDAIHDGQRQGECVGAQTVIEGHILDIRLADAFVESSPPPGGLRACIGDFRIDRRNQTASHVGNEQSLGRCSDDGR